MAARNDCDSAALHTVNAKQDCAAVSILQRMYKTGEWSDLTIEADDGQLVLVHKSVVCPASDYISSKCGSGFGKILPGHIKMHEGPRIVEALMSHMYQLPADWTVASYYTASEKKVVLPIPDAYDLIRLCVAAEKYGISSIAPSIEESFSALLHRELDRRHYKGVVTIGRKISDEEGAFLCKMRHTIVAATVEMSRDIFEDEVALKVLRGSFSYLQQTVSYGRGSEEAEL